MISYLEEAKKRLEKIVAEGGLRNAPVTVRVKILTAQEAIGDPERRDFPIIVGKERVIEAEVMGTRAHAFTDSPGGFSGTLGEILDAPLDNSRSRAIFVAALNGVLENLGLTEKCLHCRDEDPERCAVEIASTLLAEKGRMRVGLIGLNPAIAERLAEVFGAGNVAVTDLNADNIGVVKFGVEIRDGRTGTEDLVRWADTIVLTGTTLVNGTFDGIMDAVCRHGKDYRVYGVTAAGVCSLAELKRICPYGRDAQ